MVRAGELLVDKVELVAPASDTVSPREGLEAAAVIQAGATRDLGRRLPDPEEGPGLDRSGAEGRSRLAGRLPLVAGFIRNGKADGVEPTVGVGVLLGDAGCGVSIPEIPGVHRKSVV